MNIAGRTALITGASTGIGWYCVVDLIKAGVTKCAILDINVEGGNAAEKKQRSELGNEKLKFYKCDVTNHSEFESVVATAVKELRTVDIFINNAGILNDNLWKETIAINLSGTILGTYLAFKHMSKEKGGSGGTVVNMASILSMAPLAGAPVYAATKHAVRGFTSSYALPYHHDRSGIRMMVLCPGVTQTALISKAGAMTDSDNSQASKELASLEPQPPEAVGAVLVKMLRDGKNGSIWVSEGGKSYEVAIPDRADMKK